MMWDEMSADEIRAAMDQQISEALLASREERSALIACFRRLGYARPGDTAAAISRNAQNARIAQFIAPVLREVIDSKPRR